MVGPRNSRAFPPRPMLGHEGLGSHGSTRQTRRSGIAAIQQSGPTAPRSDSPSLRHRGIHSSHRGDQDSTNCHRPRLARGRRGDRRAPRGPRRLGERPASARPAGPPEHRGRRRCERARRPRSTCSGHAPQASSMPAPSATRSTPRRSTSSSTSASARSTAGGSISRPSWRCSTRPARSRRDRVDG